MYLSTRGIKTSQLPYLPVQTPISQYQYPRVSQHHMYWDKWQNAELTSRAGISLEDNNWSNVDINFKMSCMAQKSFALHLKNSEVYSVKNPLKGGDGWPLSP